VEPDELQPNHGGRVPRRTGCRHRGLDLLWVRLRRHRRRGGPERGDG